MTFQFQCPQGHLLEGDESQAGQQCNCPTCGMLFIIPAPAGFAAYAGQVPDPMQPGIPDLSGGAVGAFNPENPMAPAEPQFLHIPCPKGHELEVPPEMIGQDVMCPHCHAQFQLREKDSVEYKRKKQEERELQDQRAGKLWLNWAVVIGVLVLLTLVGLMVMTSG